jgi:hypothetical protein
LEVHADHTDHLYLRAPQTTSRSSTRLTRVEWIETSVATGLLAGVVMTLPLLLWDWTKSSHLALELPTATTAWLFGLQHFSHQAYHFWPVVLGFGFWCLYWIASGFAFTGIAGRVYAITGFGKSLALGAAWSVVNFIFFWYMLLPIARNGAPFRATASTPGQFVAPDWVWILAFTAFGLAVGLFYAWLRPPASPESNDRES